MINRNNLTTKHLAVYSLCIFWLVAFGGEAKATTVEAVFSKPTEPLAIYNKLLGILGDSTNTISRVMVSAYYMKPVDLVYDVMPENPAATEANAREAIRNTDPLYMALNNLVSNDIRIIVDQKEHSDPNNLAKWYTDELDLLPNVNVIVCDYGCLLQANLVTRQEKEVINHNKYWLIERSSALNTIVQTSLNLSDDQLTHYQDALFIEDDDLLFSAYSAYFEKQWAGANLNDTRPAYDYTVVDGDALTPLNLRAYFFPAADRGIADEVLSLLNRITPDADCNIHIAMHFWSKTRQPLVDKLNQLANDGCSVYINLEARDGFAEVISTQYGDHYSIDFDPLTGSHQFGQRINVARVEKLHSKNILINARYNGSSTPQKMLWMGSHNLTVSALRENDETLLEVRNDPIYDDYLQYWHDQRENLGLQVTAIRFDPLDDDFFNPDREFIQFSNAGNAVIDLCAYQFADLEQEVAHSFCNPFEQGVLEISPASIVRVYSSDFIPPTTDLYYNPPESWGALHSTAQFIEQPRNFHTGAGGALWNDEGDTVRLFSKNNPDVDLDFVQYLDRPSKSNNGDEGSRGRIDLLMLMMLFFIYVAFNPKLSLRSRLNIKYS